jgi:hypothetical protein
MEDGLQKKVTEQYVVDALSFTEAEARIIEEMSQYISGQFDVVEIDRCVFKEVFFMGWGEKVYQNSVEDFARAVKKGDKKEAKKVYDRPLEEDFKNTGSYWYKSKVQFITTDEKTDKVKKSNVYYLVEGTSLANARTNIDAVFQGTMIDYKIASISETNIEDVFEYKHSDDKPEYEK